MNWEFVHSQRRRPPKRSPACEPAMDSDRSRPSTSVPPVPSGPISPASPATPSSPTTSCRRATSASSAPPLPRRRSRTRDAISSASPAISCAITGAVPAPPPSTTSPRRSSPPQSGTLRPDRRPATLAPALAALRPRDRQLLWLAHAENYSTARSPRSPAWPPRASACCSSGTPEDRAALEATRHPRPEPAMTFICCAREKEILDLLKTGHLPRACAPELHAHVQSCLQCRDVIAVTQAFQQARAESARAARLQAAGVLWWRAQLRAATRQSSALLSRSPPLKSLPCPSMCWSPCSSFSRRRGTGSTGCRAWQRFPSLKHSMSKRSGLRLHSLRLELVVRHARPWNTGPVRRRRPLPGNRTPMILSDDEFAPALRSEAVDGPAGSDHANRLQSRIFGNFPGLKGIGGELPEIPFSRHFDIRA